MKRRFILGSIIAIVLVGGLIFRPNTSTGLDGTRIVTIYIDGEKRTIATSAETVQGVIKQLGSMVSEQDKTEPALDALVRGTEFTINVYRARPITVTDGANNYTIVTAERSPAAIAKNAGFETKQEDEFVYRRTDDTFAGAPGTQMIILRSKEITLSLYGKKSKLSTRAETVQDLLDERDIKLEKNDELNVSLERVITEGMTVRIDSVTRNLKTVEEDVEFEEEQIQDAQQSIDYRKVKTPGVKGKKLVTYEIVRRNNGRPQRIVRKEVITKRPVKQVVIVGAKQFSGDFAAALAKLRSCEGGYDSWNPAGPYYGAYQFDRQTWGTVADPKKYGNATPAEQDAAAYRLYQARGWSPWPHCGASIPDVYR